MKRLMKKMMASLLALSLCIGSIMIAKAEEPTRKSELTAEDFGVVGASIRFVEENTKVNGIRFGVGIKKETYEAMETGVKEKLRLLVMPKVLVDGELEVGESKTVGEIVAEASDTALGAKWELNDAETYYVSYVYLYDIDENYSTVELTARAYWQADASSAPVYSTAINRSYTYVADAALADISATYTDVQESALLGVLYKISRGEAQALSYVEGGVTVTTTQGKEAWVRDVRNTVPKDKDFTLEVDMSPLSTGAWAGTMQGVKIGGLQIGLNKTGMLNWSDKDKNGNSDKIVITDATSPALKNAVPSDIHNNPFTLIIDVVGQTNLTVSVRVNNKTTVLAEGITINPLTGTYIDYYCFTNEFETLETTYKNVKVSDYSRYQVSRGEATMITPVIGGVTITTAKGKEAWVRDMRTTVPKDGNFTLEVGMSPLSTGAWAGTMQGVKIGGLQIGLNKTGMLNWSDKDKNGNSDKIVITDATSPALKNAVPSDIHNNPFTLIIDVVGKTTLNVSVKIGETITVLAEGITINPLTDTYVDYYAFTNEFDTLATTYTNVKVTEHARYSVVRGEAMSLTNVDGGVSVTTANGKEAWVKDLTNSIPYTGDFTVEVDMSALSSAPWVQTQQGLKIGNLQIGLNSGGILMWSDSTKIAMTTELKNAIPNDIKSSSFTFIVDIVGTNKVTISVKVNGTTTVLAENIAINAYSGAEIRYYSYNGVYDSLVTTYTNVKVTDNSTN